MTKKIFLFICATLLVGIALYTPKLLFLIITTFMLPPRKQKLNLIKLKKKLSKKQENMLSLAICLKIVSLKN